MSGERLPPGVQQLLADPALPDLYILATFRLQTKSATTVLGLYSASDGSRYFEFTVMGRLNKGECVSRRGGFLLPFFPSFLCRTPCSALAPTG